MRSALGASRLQLARQFLVEGLLLAALGGAAAMALAWSMVGVVPRLVPQAGSSVVLGVSLRQIDSRVLAFGLLLSIATGMLCAAAPALRASKTDPARGLSSSDRLTGSGEGLAGLAAGLTASLWVSRLLTSQLYEVRPNDPATLFTVVTVLLAVSAAAAFGPVYRATRVDPLVTLRAE